MQNHDLVLSTQTLWRFDLTRQAQHVCACFRRIEAVVATVEGSGQLREYAPDKSLLGELILSDKVPDQLAEISTTTVFHVQVQVLSVLEMVAVVVCDDVRVPQRTEDGELGM